MAVCAFHTFVFCLFLVVIIAMSTQGSVLLEFFVSICPFHKWNNFQIFFYFYFIYLFYFLFFYFGMSNFLDPWNPLCRRSEIVVTLPAVCQVLVWKLFR
jgi:hypothetical protein